MNLEKELRDFNNEFKEVSAKVDSLHRRMRKIMIQQRIPGAAIIAAQINGLDYNLIFSKTRQRRVVDARSMVTNYCVSLGISTLQLGSAFGNDHTTVLNHKQRHADLMETDWAHKATFDKFLFIITGNYDNRKEQETTTAQ